MFLHDWQFIMQRFLNLRVLKVLVSKCQMLETAGHKFACITPGNRPLKKKSPMAFSDLHMPENSNVHRRMFSDNVRRKSEEKATNEKKSDNLRNI